VKVVLGLVVILASQSVWALGGFIGLTVGAGSDYATENIVEAENEAHCNELFPGQPELCDSIDPELSNLESYQSVVPPSVPKQDVGLVVVNNQLPDDPTPENVAEAAAEVKASLGLPPDAPVTASTYAAINEINAVNSNNQNAAQLCASLVKLSIGNQGNCANYLSITQGQTLNVADLRSAIQLADALELLSAPSIDNLIRSKLGNSVDPQEIHDVCVASGLVPFEPENSRACAVIYLLSQGIYDRSLLLELPCIGEINYPELLDEWFEEQFANDGIPDYDAICAFALASQRPDRVPPELVVSAVDVTVFANDLPGRPLVRITATDARSDVTLEVTENEYLDLVTGEDGQATLVVRQPAFSQTEKLFLTLGATDMAGNVTSLDIGLAVNLGERPATGLEDYPELTFVHWEGAIGAQALPNLFLDAGWSAQFVGPQGAVLPTSLRPQGNTLAWMGAPEPTEFWIQVTNADDQVADTLTVQLQVEAGADAVDVRAVPAPLAGVSLDAQAWQDFCVNNGLTEKGNTYSLPFIPSDQLDAFMALVEVPPSIELPDASATTPTGEQCPTGPVSSTALAGAITVGDQVAMKVNDQIRLVPGLSLVGPRTHLALDGCDAPRVKLTGAVCLLDRSAPWR
jgi:hypothetical protein